MFSKLMEYKDFTAQDFSTNGFFIKWVKKPDSETNWFWKSFLIEYPEKAEEIEEAKKLILLLKFQEKELTEESISSMRNRILMAVRSENEMAKDNDAGFFKKNDVQKRITMIRWVAVISFPLSMLAVVYFLMNDASPLNSNKISKKSSNTVTEKQINPKGQKSVLLLSDGTRVWLNADSRLDYTKDFGTGNIREVQLEGEAYFDVAPNPAKPFIVRTSALSITVLGTAFNVKSYADDKTIETTLVHGKVSINRTGTDEDAGSLILKPNQRAVFIKESNTVNVEQVVSNRSASWRFDKLIFDETPFYDAISQLERWYDIKIHVEDGGDLDCGLSAEIENERLEDVLKLLELSHQVHCTVSGKDVFIKGPLCK